MDPQLPPLHAASETVTDYAARSALYFGDRIAVVDVAKGEGGRYSFRRMNERAERLAGFLLDRGVCRGERVGLLAHNGVEYLDALLACAKLGAIFVPYNFRLHPRELLEVVQQTGPRAFVYSPDFAVHVELLRREHPDLATYLHTGHEAREGSIAIEAVMEQHIPVIPYPPGRGLGDGPASLEDPLCLLFTGGTTGLSKAAVISHRMIGWNSLTTLIHEINRDDVTVVHTPMFHTGGLLVYAVPLFLCGGRTLILRKWDVDEMLGIIERERVTMFFCVPTQYQMMLQSPRLTTTRFDSVRFVTSGGAPLPVPVIEAFRKIHDVPFKQGFGMTEFGPGCFSMGPEFAASKAGSIGRPNSFVAARIVDDEGRALPPGEAGELLLKGPSMFSGYYRNDEATRAAIDPEGWFHTGDVARADADGFFFIVDRKKDMFISGGENVYPVEIERALYEHPAVLQCAVLGVPDEKWGQVGRAFVVLRPGASTTESQLLDFLRERLARYKVPKSVRVIDVMPVSPAGKILKRALPAD